MRITVKTFALSLVILAIFCLFDSGNRLRAQPGQEELKDRIILAVKNGNLPAVKKLIEDDPSLILTIDLKGGNMPKFGFYGHELIVNGSRFTVFDDRGGNLLHIAAAATEPNIDVIKFLIESGINTNELNNEGFEPTLVAILANNGEAAYHIYASRRGDIDEIGGSRLISTFTSDTVSRRVYGMGGTDANVFATVNDLQRLKRNAILNAIYALKEMLKKYERAKHGDISFVGHTTAVKSAIFLPDGKRVLTTDGKPTIRIWDAETGKELSKFDNGVIIHIRYALSPDGKRVVTTPDIGVLVGNKSDDDLTSRIWDVESGKMLLELGGDKAYFKFIEFSPDGKKIAAVEDRSVQIWDAESGVEDRSVQIWDAESGKELRKIEGDTNSFFENTVFSPDGKKIVARDRKNNLNDIITFIIWDVDTGKELLKFDVTGDAWFDIFSPDGRKFIYFTYTYTGTRKFNWYDNTLRILDTNTGKELQKIEWSSAAPDKVVFSPDGKKILTKQGKPACIWDVESGKKLLELRGSGGGEFSDNAGCAIFSPDGKKIATAFFTTCRIFDADTGKELQKLEGGHEDRINSVAFSPDGKSIVTASDDKTARIWNLE